MFNRMCASELVIPHVYFYFKAFWVPENLRDLTRNGFYYVYEKKTKKNQECSCMWQQIFEKRRMKILRLFLSENILLLLFCLHNKSFFPAS